MKLKWEEGRQGSGYFKLKLFESDLFKFDLHLLKFPTGSYISIHKDPAPEGWEHHRLNIILKKARGGYFCNRINEDGWENVQPIHPDKRRFIKFRPDIENHCVSMVAGGTRWVLSIGWLRRK